MAGRFVRDSKLRNVFGQAVKKDQFYESVRVSKHNNVAMFCAVNPKFMAVVTQAAGGGSFLVLPHNQTGRVDVAQPQIVGHKGPVIDVAWSPFNDNLIASCDENGNIMLWMIPDGGLTSSLEEAVVSLDTHQKRVVILKWHPTVEHVLLSASLDGKLIIWNVYEGDIIHEIQLPDVVQDACWNYDGSMFAFACKNRNIYLYNAATGTQYKKEFQAHESNRDVRVCLLKNNQIFTTGFSKMSKRQYTMRNLDDLDHPTVDEDLDQTNAPLNIFYDPDLSMIYLVGKGDTVVRYYEVTQEEPYIHYITTYQSNQPQRGMGFMPKRGCNVNACEVVRMYKVTVSTAVGAVEPISFIVPRKSELYQSDVYPDTAANEPSRTIEEWLAGKDCSPKKMSMMQFYVEKESSTGKSGGLGGLKKKAGGGLKKKETPAPAASTPAPAAKVEPPKPSPVSSVKAPTPVVNSSKGQSEQIDDLIAEITKLKATVAEQEKRIAALEGTK